MPYHQQADSGAFSGLIIAFALFQDHFLAPELVPGIPFLVAWPDEETSSQCLTDPL